MFNGFNKFLLFVFLMAGAACFLIRPDYSRRNYELFPEMKYSPSWATYEPNPHFKNGRTLQLPVPNTIARGQLPLGFVATKEDAIRAGEELQNPYQRAITKAEQKAKSKDAAPDDAQNPLRKKKATDAVTSPLKAAREALEQSRARGRQQYLISCICCHGVKGGGDGPVAKRGFPPPPTLLQGKPRTMEDGQLFHILSFGQTTMPAFADQLSRAERWDLVNHLRAMQETVPPAQAPSSQPTTKKKK